MSERRLLVTGARGFVGRHVLPVAQSGGFEVHAAARSVPEADIGLDVSWHVCDLLKDGVPERLVDDIRPTHILHAAWQTTHGRYWTSHDNVLWLAATARLAHAFATANGQRFVLVGSCAEYDWSTGVMVEGVTPTRPHTLYGASKLATHDLIQALGRESGFSAVNGRIFFAYGPWEHPKRLIPYLSCALVADEDALMSSGTQIRDFLHVEDAATAFVALLDSDATGAINIGMGEPVRLCEIAHHLGVASGRSDRIRIGARPDRTDDVPVLVPDTSRLRALGWQPRKSLAEGLRDTYEWWAARDKA